jgi:hypothetical protein
VSQALQYINQDIPGFCRKIDEQLRINKEDRDRERLRQMEGQANGPNGKLYDMRCRKCNGFIARSTDIYLLHEQYYVAVDDKIWQRVNVHPMPTDRPESSTPAIGKVFFGFWSSSHEFVIKIRVFMSQMSKILIFKNLLATFLHLLENLHLNCGIEIFTQKRTQIIFTNNAEWNMYREVGLSCSLQRWRRCSTSNFHLQS